VYNDSKLEKQIDEAVIQELQTAVEQFSWLKLKDEEAAIELANHYLTLNQNDKAIELLERLINTGRQTPSIYRILGDILVMNCSYSQARAKEAYEKAIGLASNARDFRDIEILIAAKGGLSSIESNLGNEDEAKLLLEQARTLCEASCKTFTELGIGSELSSRLRLLVERKCGECPGPGRWVGSICRRCNC